MKKIVFIVYKAGWWCSFDTLYEQYSKDKNAICFVMPIPYYEKNRGSENLNYSKVHIESKMLPDRVVITDYKKFVLADEKPDIIYIHNPYDAENAVESVDPKYYSNNLRQFTEKLIYIPHMLYIDQLPEIMMRLPVYENVNSIMVANNLISEEFSRYVQKEFIVNPEKETLYLKRLIADLNIKEDNADKRKVLYYIGFSDLLDRTERIIKKIRYMFGIMKTRTDVDFILRVDPEIKFRFNELPRIVQNEYKRLINEYIDEEIGSFDSSENEYEVAIKADAYMGKGHPICNLFGLQGKPIFILDDECRVVASTDELSSSWITDAEVEGKYIWFIANEYNALCKMSIDTAETIVVAEIPEESVKNSFGNYYGIKKIDNSIYLIPRNSSAITIYNIKRNEFEKIFLFNDDVNKFQQVVFFNECLYLFPMYYEGIIQYNIYTKECIYHTEWIEHLEKFVESEDSLESFFQKGVLVEGEVVLLASSKANVVMEFNMTTGDYNLFEVGKSGDKFFEIESDGEYYWLLPYKGNKIIAWDKKNNIWNEYDLPIEGKVVVPYVSITKYMDNLILWPCEAESVIEINIKSKKMKQNEFVEKNSDRGFKSEYFKKTNLRYSFVEEIDDSTFLASEMYDRTVKIYNMKNDTISKIACRLSSRYVNMFNIKKIERERNSLKFPCFINELSDVNSLINYIVQSKDIINYMNLDEYTRYLKK